MERFVLIFVCGIVHEKKVKREEERRGRYGEVWKGREDGKARRGGEERRARYGEVWKGRGKGIERKEEGMER